MIILDTDVLVEIFDKKSIKGDQALDRIRTSGQGIAITSMTLYEIMYGLEKYAKPVSEILQLPVLAYTGEDAKLAASLELEVERRGKAVRRTDAMIAAMAMTSGASLYSFDGHFKSIESLKKGLVLF